MELWHQIILLYLLYRESYVSKVAIPFFIPTSSVMMGPISLHPDETSSLVPSLVNSLKLLTSILLHE